MLSVNCKNLHNMTIDIMVLTDVYTFIYTFLLEKVYNSNYLI